MNNVKDGMHPAHVATGMKRPVSVVQADVYNDFDCLRVTGMLARFWWVGRDAASWK